MTIEMIASKKCQEVNHTYGKFFTMKGRVLSNYRCPAFWAVLDKVFLFYCVWYISRCVCHFQPNFQPKTVSQWAKSMSAPDLHMDMCLLLRFNRSPTRVLDRSGPDFESKGLGCSHSSSSQRWSVWMRSRLCAGHWCSSTAWYAVS